MDYRIEKLAKGGAGVTRHEGKTFFVEGALPGESGIAEILEEKARFGRCRAVTRAGDSPVREISDACSVKRCNGCGFRHVKTEYALRLKSQAVYEEIMKGAHLSDIPYECVELDQWDGTRRRVRLHVDGGKIGYFARDSHDVVSAARCCVVDPGLREVIEKLEADFPVHSMCGELQVDLDDLGRAFVHVKPSSDRVLRRKQHMARKREISRSGGSGDWDRRSLRKFAETQIAGGGFAGIRIEDEFFGERLIRDTTHVDGADVVTYRRVGDFGQATSQANDQIHAQVMSFLETYKPDSVADLYSGSGNLSFRAASMVPRVDAYELFCDEKAFGAGLEANGGHLVDKTKVTLHLADLSRGLPQDAFSSEVMICDPARDGLSERLAADICASKAKALLYVSCEASCLGRDLTRLCGVFSLEKLIFIDMFPMTPLVETVAWLVRC